MFKIMSKDKKTKKESIIPINDYEDFKKLIIDELEKTNFFSGKTDYHLYLENNETDLKQWYSAFRSIGTLSYIEALDKEYIIDIIKNLSKKSYLKA